MKVHPLYSSSDGNACRVYNDNNSILIDCGVSKRKLFSNGVFPIDAIFVTHEHSDHANGIGVIGRATGASIYIYKGIHKKLKYRYALDSCNIKYISKGKQILIGDLKVTPYPTSHDVQYSFYYIVEEKSTKAKYCHITDTGMFLPEMYENIKKCDALLLEMNYDENKLDQFDGYAQFQKNRIKSDVGHLGVQQTIDFIKNNLNLNKFQWIGLGHISPRTNDYKIIHKRLHLYFPDYKHFYYFPGNTYLNIINPNEFHIDKSNRNEDYKYEKK
jgi:phosphoribosyl 1,2-cyclic phosphodiesterase